MCVYLSYSDKKGRDTGQGEKKKKHTLTHHLQGRYLAGDQEKERVTRVPTSEWNRDELPRPFFPAHFYSSFPFHPFTSSLATHWATHTHLPGGQSFLDDCWIAFEPQLPKHIFSKLNFRASEISCCSSSTASNTLCSVIMQEVVNDGATGQRSTGRNTL